MEVMKQITCESEANACSRSLRLRIQIKKGDIMRNVKMRFNKSSNYMYRKKIIINKSCSSIHGGGMAQHLPPPPINVAGSRGVSNILRGIRVLIPAPSSESNSEGILL